MFQSHAARVYILESEGQFIVAFVGWMYSVVACVGMDGYGSEMEELVADYQWMLSDLLAADLSMNASSLPASDMATSITNNTVVKFYHKVFWELSGELISLKSIMCFFRAILCILEW